MTTTGKITVDPKIIAATECDKDFACLSDSQVYCSVLTTLGHVMVQLECRQRLDCRHNKSYSGLQTCNCPVRHEIFTKYGK